MEIDRLDSGSNMSVGKKTLINTKFDVATIEERDEVNLE